MSEFTGIQGLAAWRAKLKELLVAAEGAARQTQLDPRLAVVERLTQFIERSWPDDEQMRALDGIATQAIQALLDQNIDERLQSIAQRNAELAGLAKQFSAAAAQAQQEAASIRLQQLQDALSAVNGGIAALQKLEFSLDTADNDELGQAVDGALGAARRLRDLLETRA